ncbi:MAG TPA: hypothetical protein VK694_02085 [Verrucomicrobiae bacterium]|nr:hypothetical protein [Verrucomicrobiae bacterium]
MSFSPEHMPSEPETFPWVVEVDGRVHDLSITLYEHPDASSRDTLAQYYGGLGERGLALPKAVHELGVNDLQATAVELPFRELPAEAKYIEFMATEAPQAVAAHLNERAGKPGDAPAHRLGNSQGSGVALISAGAAPEGVDIVAVMGVLGLNKEAFQNHPLGAKAGFLYRFAVKNALLRMEQNLLVDPKGNFDAIREVGGYVLAEMLSGRLNPTLDYALDKSLVPQLSTLIAEGHDVGLFLGKRDPNFRPKEVGATLDTIGARSLLHVVPGSHGTTNNWGGRRQLGHVGRWVRQVEDDRNLPEPDEAQVA